MNRIIFTLGIWLFPAACTALGAAGVFLLRRQTRPATRRILCGMAAGIMLAASVWSLLLPAIARSQGRAAWVPPALGLILGAVGLLRLEDAAGQLLAGGPGHCGRMVLAVTLHNLPEGILTLLTNVSDPQLGARTALAIALHNIPEGLAVAVPFACATGSRAKGAVAALVSGLAEPAGAVLAALVLAPLLTPGLLNGIVAVVAGIMLWVAAAQLLPAAFEPAWRKMGVTGFCVGVLMMIPLSGV